MPAQRSGAHGLSRRLAASKYNDDGNPMKAEVTRPAFSFERKDPDGRGDDAAPPGNPRTGIIKRKTQTSARNHHDRQPVGRATSGSSSRTRHEAHLSQDFLPAL